MSPESEEPERVPDRRWSDSGQINLNEAADALPGVARIAGTAVARASAWSLGAGLRSVRNLGRALTSREAAGELVRGVAHDLAEASRAVSDVAHAVSSGESLPKAVFDASVSLSAALTPEEPAVEPEHELTLRERGEALLRKSRDVWREVEEHPAYSQILDQMAPDEARILVLLLRGGPQPSVDVRTGGPVGMVSSSLVSAGMNMIGPRAGLRNLDEVPAYLNNLNRLGLIWFSREQVEDPLEYQVVEAQPDVLEAMHSVRFAKVVRRSIHLTPFGVDFCRRCLVDEEPGEVLPVHEAPQED